MAGVSTDAGRGTSGRDAGFDGRDELLDFLERHLPNGWIDAATSGDEATVLALRDALDKRAFVRLLGVAGWVAPQWPVEYGGRGLADADAVAALSLLDHWEVPRMPRGSGLPLAAPAILQWSAEPTKRRFLPPIASGEERWCQLFSEPGAGSDLASLATSAVRDGDEWVVNGQKVWTTMGHESEFAMLLARTDPLAPKHAGITYFGVDLGSPGVEVRALVNMAGQVEFNEVFLTDVRVPDLHRISPPGEGWGATQTTLGAERHALSGMRKKRKASDEILGGKTWADVLAAAGAQQMTDDPVVRNRLAEEWTLGQVLALSSRRAAANREAGRAGGPEGSISPQGSISKVAKAMSNQSLQVLAMDVLGAQACAWIANGERSGGGAAPGEPVGGSVSDGIDAGDFVVQFLRTRANSIEGGTSEIQRNIIGERVLGLPREPDPFRGQPWNEVPRS